jgi:hypothetical protein
MNLRNFILYMLLAAITVSGCSLIDGGSTDQATLDQLRDAGSDLSKPHPFDFYLYHAEQSGAEQLCTALSTDGFQVSVRESAAGGEWLCLASFTMLPTIENLTELDARFSRLIDQYGGEYDGWETMVLP